MDGYSKNTEQNFKSETQFALESSCGFFDDIFIQVLLKRKNLKDKVSNNLLSTTKSRRQNLNAF